MIPTPQMIPTPEGNGKIAILLSGGMDSATLFFDLLDAGWAVLPIRVNYGQRHSRELDASRQLSEYAAKRFGERVMEPVEIDFSALGRQLLGSSQTDATVPVPHGHYADENMKKTVVPNRNMILLAAATGVASSRETYYLAYGAHAGDHAIYPDCRQEFIDKMAAALLVCDYEPIVLVAPYGGIDKRGILERGFRIGVPYELTWTCYEGGDKACGKCGSCQERLEGFAANGVTDPVPYA